MTEKMNKKTYIKPCIKERYILPEPVSFTVSTSSDATEDACSKSYNSDSGSGNPGIWSSMESDEEEDEE